MTETEEAFQTLTEALREHPHSRPIVQAGLDSALLLLEARKEKEALRALELLFRLGGNVPEFEQVSAYRKWVASWVKA